MMSKERRTLLITTFICLCSLLVYISFTAVYPEPKTVQQNLYSNMLFVGGIVINVVLNIVLNFKVCKTMGAKFLVKLGKWIMPFTSIFLVIVSIYSTIYPNSSFSNIATIVFVGCWVELKECFQKCDSVVYRISVYACVCFWCLWLIV